MNSQSCTASRAEESDQAERSTWVALPMRRKISTARFHSPDSEHEHGHAGHGQQHAPAKISTPLKGVSSDV
jgi:hypothetical protein